MNAQVLKALWEKRTKVLTDIQALAELTNGREPSEEEKDSEKRMVKDLTEIDGKLEKGMDDIEREMRAAESFKRYEGLMNGTLKDVTEKTTEIESGLRDFLKGEKRSWEYELDPRVVDAYDIGTKSWERRDLLESTGGMPLPRSFSGQLYEAYVQAAATLRAKGVSNTQDTLFLTSSGESLDVPRAMAHGNATWTAEGVAGTEADATLSFITLSAFKAMQIVQVSQELITDEGFDIVGYVARSAGRNCGLLADAAYTVGTGTGQPTGFQNNATVGATGLTGSTTSVTYDSLIDLEFSVLDYYRQAGVWVMANTSVAAVAKVKDTTGRPIWQPGLVPGQPDTLLGRPIVVSASMPVMAANAKSIAFGDFAGYAVRIVRGVRFERSDDFAFNADLATFKAVLRTDGKLIDTAALKVYQNSAT